MGEPQSTKTQGKRKKELTFVESIGKLIERRGKVKQ
jgi:hypothetical protein